MKKGFFLLFMAALLLAPTVDVQAQYRKKKYTTDVIKEGNNKRMWLGNKTDTSWHPTPGGLYEQVTQPDLSGKKKGKKTEPIIDDSGKHKVREAAYDTVYKFTTFNGKTFYYIDYDYNKFRQQRWMRASERNFEEFQPVWNYITSAGRIPMHLCAVFAVNPTATDPDKIEELASEARMEALISLDYFRDIVLEQEMKNKITYKVVQVDYRYWKDEAYFTEEQPTDEVIRVGLVVDFSAKKIDLFPSAAAGAKTYADVKFFPNDATIQESYKPLLDDLAEYMKENSGLEVLLTGYCDNVGTEAYNLGLSRQRAVEVKKALVKRGIAEHRIEIDAKGEENPIGDNNTYSGRLANNRVSVVMQ